MTILFLSLFFLHSVFFGHSLLPFHHLQHHDAMTQTDCGKQNQNQFVESYYSKLFSALWGFPVFFLGSRGPGTSPNARMIGKKCQVSTPLIRCTGHEALRLLCSPTTPMMYSAWFGLPPIMPRDCFNANVLCK